jgi:hypothetical protein
VEGWMFDSSYACIYLYNTAGINFHHGQYRHYYSVFVHFAELK